MPITREDILDGNECPQELSANVDQLVYKVNLLEAHYGHDLMSTSGLRNMKHHIEIYRQKALKAKKVFDESKVPKKSKHLFGQADDLVPVNPALLDDFKKFIFQNPKLMEEIGLWFEDFKYTPTWVHAQTVPPGSGKRFFIP